MPEFLLSLLAIGLIIYLGDKIKKLEHRIEDLEGKVPEPEKD